MRVGGWLSLAAGVGLSCAEGVAGRLAAQVVARGWLKPDASLWLELGLGHGALLRQRPPPGLVVTDVRADHSGRDRFVRLQLAPSAPA